MTKERICEKCSVEFSVLHVCGDDESTLRNRYCKECLFKVISEMGG